MKNKPVYSLAEIAEWDEKQQVSLPTVQRGFVWKPYQIENLWDSLLRGYPVGAFVLSPAENNTFHILDGQQRATAICLGFAKETFRDSQDYYKVFIDLDLPAAEDSRKYLFRVITRSHPWGYRKQENNKTLTSENIRKAMDLYEDVNDPLTSPLDKFFPFDAGLPLPFHYFITASLNAQGATELYKRIEQEFAHWEKTKKRWLNTNESTLQQKTPEEIDRVILNKIKNILDKTGIMMCEKDGQKIPALYMKLENMMQEDQPADANHETEGADEVENLFVRLNAGGTQLSGEELNYSILKAHLSRESQDLIESACKQLFKPSRFITIAYRLFQQVNKDAQQADALTMRIKPKQFQRSVGKQAKDFEDFLLDTISNKRFDGKSLLDYTQSVLEYEKEKQPFGLPFLIYSKIADTAPELMFLLLYRVKLKGDRFQSGNKEEEIEHRRMLGMITLFMWFGKGENLKDHARLLANIWPAASSLVKHRFWSSETIERAYMNNALLPFPAFTTNKHENGLNSILEYKISEKTNILNSFDNKAGEEYRMFLQKAIYNRDLILYAQRHFIESYFRNQQYRLEDTSLPFDWDHISPNKLVRNKKNIPNIAKEWYQTNGNFRAWPYALNRMDSDNSPACKLNPLENTDEEVNGNTELKTKWENFIRINHGLIKNTNQIQEKLKEWSFCETDWLHCYVHNMRTEWKTVTKLILQRNIKLLQQWYKELNIEDLRKELKINITDILDNRKWSVLPLNNSAFDEEFDLDEDINRISSSFEIGNTHLSFYFSYPDGDNGYFEIDSIELGLFEVEGNNYIQNMRNKSDFKVDNHNFKWIFDEFSLISSHFNSYVQLLNEMIEWLRSLPVSNADKKLLVAKFKEMLSSKFKSVVK